MTIRRQLVGTCVPSVPTEETAITSPTRPVSTDHATWRRERDALLAREKAHTHEGDAIAAARRRLPMTEVDGTAEMDGAAGPTRVLDMFEGRPQLLVFRHMWHLGQPFAEQCEGCTATVWNFHDATYLNVRGVTFAVWCAGPYEEFAPFREFMGYQAPWYSRSGLDVPGISYDGGISVYLRLDERVFLTYDTDFRGVEAMMPALQLLDMTVYGRQETWEDSPEGWPQDRAHSWLRRDGRPLPQLGRRTVEG